MSLAIVAGFAGCTSSAEQPKAVKDSGIDIVGIIIQNDLAYVVRDVMVTVPATGAYAGCGNLLQRSSCRTSFPARDYRKNAVKVTWSERGENKETDEFFVDLPADATIGDVFWLEVAIYAPGLAGARLVRP
jgi:hypothetical protein